MSDLIRILAGYAGPPGFESRCEAAESDTRLHVVAGWLNYGYTAKTPSQYRVRLPGSVMLEGEPDAWWSAYLMEPASVAHRSAYLTDPAFAACWVYLEGGRIGSGTPMAAGEDKATLLNHLKGRSIEQRRSFNE